MRASVRLKERADARDYAISNTVEPFLGVMDNFQLALKADGTAGATAGWRGADSEADGRGAEGAECAGGGVGGGAVRPANP